MEDGVRVERGYRKKDYMLELLEPSMHYRFMWMEDVAEKLMHHASLESSMHTADMDLQT